MDIAAESDVVQACREGRALAERLGFAASERAYVVTAISEIAGNVWRHAGRGRVELEATERAGRVGIAVTTVPASPI